MTNSLNTPPVAATKTFADVGVNPEICASLAAAGITSPFPIQELTLPLALQGADLIGQARTGTGKTLAFGIPLLQRVDLSLRKTQALVVVPTRELCVQVTADLTQAGSNLGLEVVAVYGGKALEPQAAAVEAGAHVVVGTPGRLLDLLRRGSLNLSQVAGLVLDEADEMLDLGFLPDVEQLIEATAEGRQTLLFSATMPSAVVALARRYMHKPTFLRADVEEVHVAPKTKQHFFSCHRMDKPAVVARILQAPNRGLCVVFTRTKRMADVLAEELRERGITAAPIHSDLRQEAREKALDRFRKGTISVLVATEVAARGLDIDDVTHVVNYDCPEDEKMYLHRIGRTGRAGADGVAVTLVLWNELARLEMIKKSLDITEPTHEVFSTSPILDELFDLPSRDAVKVAAVAAAGANDEVEEAQALLKEDAKKSRRRTKGARKDAPADTEPAPTAAPAARARTRTRSRSAGVDAVTADAAPTRAETQVHVTSSAATGGDEDGVGDRTRVRRRTRTLGTSDAEVPAPRERSTSARSATSRTGSASRPKPDGSKDESTRDSTRRSGQPREGASRSDRGRPSQGQSQGQSRDSQARDGQGRGRQSRSESSARSARGGRTDSRSSGSRDSRGRSRVEVPEVDTAEARGAGRPIISRPLKIQHLP